MNYLRRNGAAAVCTGTKEDVLPKITDYWQVRLKIHPGDINEDGTERLVSEGATVEGFGERDDVVTRRDIGTFGQLEDSGHWAYRCQPACSSCHDPIARKRS